MTKIKVGVDARLLSRPLTGIGRYTMELCQALSKRADLQLILYSPNRFNSNIDFESSTTINTKQWNNGLLRQFWSEITLPLRAKSDQLDVFWGPAHRLPRLLPPNIARVVTLHDLVWKFASNTMRTTTRVLETFQVPFAIQSADKIITDCHTTANTIKKAFPESEKKLAIIFPGLTDLKKNPSTQQLSSLGITKPFCLFVGTLEPRKNLLRLLTAYSMLPESVKNDAMLVIAGGCGWGGIDIEKMLTRLNLTKHVKILGYVNDSILSLLYEKTLFLAFPSLYEGFGLPLIEAMSYGVPVLTSNISCMPEIAGDAGFLVDPYDETSIKSGLEQLICNNDLRQQLAFRAKKNCEQYNWDKAAERLLKEFHAAITSRERLLTN